MTPMFEQYHQLKSANPASILFFRMGDFYEVFYGDAEICSRELDLTLTARNKQNDNPIPMAGVPHHAAGGYIQRLVDKGYRIAIAEQVEDPALAKGLVKRAVTRVVTPGVVLDPTSLAAKDPNYLVAISPNRDGFGLAFLEASTGDLRATVVVGIDAAVAELHRMEPREALLHPKLGDAAVGALRDALRRYRTIESPVEDEAWRGDEALRELTTTLGVADLSGFGVADDHPAVSAAGALVRYARDISGHPLRNVTGIDLYRVDGFMVLDDTTRRNLELFRTLVGGKRRGTLLGLVDRCATSMGSRLLREWMSFPLLDPGAVNVRLAGVQALVEDPTARGDLRSALREVADVERIGARVSQGTAHARDLSALRRSLLAVPSAIDSVRALDTLAAHIPHDVCANIAADLDRWLVDDPPISLTDGGLLRRGVHPELDEIVSMAVSGVGVISELEAREREDTGIGSLKIRRNKVFGYFIEVTRAHLHKVPDRFLRKQTLSNAERYITPELKELEERVLGADERRKELEYQLFIELRDRMVAETGRLLALARKLAALDVLGNLAEVAERYRWVRPEVVEREVLDIRGGRHPVVEALLDEERFVPNDVQLDAFGRQLIVLTGPNMSGKSTVMRQVALIAVLAQMGSFVPADRATVGVCDRVFTRVGATDDLARGQSTFMVEMSETAAILRAATRQSLVVLDEIGRGTSTYDGLSIAWAVAEDLHDRIGCRAMFATHYHELCDLAESRPRVANQSVAVSEWGDSVVFLRRLKEGGASRSYGIQCARLAGLPDDVVERARKLLTRFEKYGPRNEREQLSLFGTVGLPDDGADEVVQSDPLRERLHELDPDALSPREALDALYRLRDLL